MPFENYIAQTLCFDGQEYTTYHRGTGPCVIVVHETPNAHPGVFELADQISEAGFQVWVPSLFGKVNEKPSPQSAVRFLARSCIWNAFSVLAMNRSSPMTDWLRGLGHYLHQQTQGPIGLIGMCITGNFALALCDEDWMEAPVLSQPSLPFAISARHAAALHVSPDTLEKAKARPDLKLLGLRFTGDRMCPAARFQSLTKAFGDRFEGIEINSGLGNPNGISPLAHSVLTLDRVHVSGHPTEDAVNRCLAFLSERLCRPA